MKAKKCLEETRAWWKALSDNLCVETEDTNFGNWMRWVIYEPFCRKVTAIRICPTTITDGAAADGAICGSDMLGLFLVDPLSTREDIINNFLGRTDRRQQCHHHWLQTRRICGRSKQYRPHLVRSRDMAILYSQLLYPPDRRLRYPAKRHYLLERSFTCAIRPSTNNGIVRRVTGSKAATGKIYRGSILEHVLLQQLSAFFHVGQHNNMLLEGGNWNDTYDMARKKGESVCFFNWYGWNLRTMAEVLETLDARGVHEIPILTEAQILLDRLPGRTRLVTTPGKQNGTACGIFRHGQTLDPWYPVKSQGHRSGQ